jgi:hypothetical protein
MPYPYFPHSGRRAHYWKLRVEGFRELQIQHRWGFRGGYAEKSIRGRRVMQTIVKTTDDYYLCCFQLKDDFWSAVTADARKREAETRRESFRVVAEREGEKNRDGQQTKAAPHLEQAAARWPITPDLDPTQLDQVSLEAIANQARLCVDSLRARIRAMYPSLTEADLDDWMLF